MDRLKRFKGCLVGGAAGDALGYAVEFMGEGAIFGTYGPRGITNYALDRGLARISDDTQMTLFTACGLLYAETNRKYYTECINEAYLDWYATQSSRFARDVGPVRSGWIRNDPRLHSPRAPGVTCLDALSRGGNGTPEKPINDSKGCGGVMRVAPIGAYLVGKCSIEDADRIGAEAAALTHGHELGFLSAALLVHIICRIMEGMRLEDAVEDGCKTIGEMLDERVCHYQELVDLMDLAVSLAGSGTADLDAIHALGEGWVAEEALAIAVYCALKYQDDFDSALIAAVNHKGDSDSTGAITGNILGALLGLEGIPAKYLENLELRDVILELAEDLYYGCPEDPQQRNWHEKYIACTYGAG